MHQHPHIHAALAKDIQARRIAEARAASAARALRAGSASEPAGTVRRWIPFLKGRVATSPQRQGA